MTVNRHGYLVSHALFVPMMASIRQDQFHDVVG
jgi:hypothetical protein